MGTEKWGQNILNKRREKISREEIINDGTTLIKLKSDGVFRVGWGGERKGCSI